MHRLHEKTHRKHRTHPLRTAPGPRPVPRHTGPPGHRVTLSDRQMKTVPGLGTRSDWPMPPSTRAQPPLSSTFTTTTGRSHPANRQHRRLSAQRPSEPARRRPVPRTGPPSTEVPGPLTEIRRFHGAGCRGSSAPARRSPPRRTARPSAHAENSALSWSYVYTLASMLTRRCGC